jgi:diaminopimelate decarboxylase
VGVREGRLMVESVAAADLAARFGTPLFVTSEAQLRANVAAWREALAQAWGHGPTRVLVSLKANPSVALRRILTEEGAGCDVFGEAEFQIALDAGVPAKTISVNGSTKSRELIARTIAIGARLTVDSLEELAIAAETARSAGVSAHVRVRLRPDLTDVAAISEFTEADPLGAVADGYKPGIPIDELLAALPALDLTGVDLAGVHAHLGRHTASAEPFRLHAQRLAGLIVRLSEALDGWTPREIDLGGGYSFAGDPTGLALRPASDERPTPAGYAAAIAEGLAEGLRQGGLDLDGIALEIEPGRAVYGSAGLHLSTVLNVKHQTAPVPRTWVACDSSEVFLSDTTWEHSRWQPVCVEPVSGDPAEVDVTGISCGFDTITPAATLPSGIAEGDVIAFLATGAYEEALAGNFNSIGRPASVLVSGEEAELIRRGETLRDVSRRELMPARLHRPRLDHGGRPRPLAGVLRGPAGPDRARPGRDRSRPDRTHDRRCRHGRHLRGRGAGIARARAVAVRDCRAGPADRSASVPARRHPHRAWRGRRPRRLPAAGRRGEQAVITAGGAARGRFGLVRKPGVLRTRPGRRHGRDRAAGCAGEAAGGGGGQRLAAGRRGAA